MTKKEVKNLKLGLYKFFWKSGGHSLVAVANDREGNPMFMACNWISGPSYDFRQVSHAEQIGQPA